MGEFSEKKKSATISEAPPATNANEREIVAVEISQSPKRESIGAHLLARLFDDYLAAIEPNVSPTTLNNYRRQISPACQFWQEYGPAHDYRIAPDTGDALLSWLRHQSGLSQNSIRTTVRRVRQYLKWLHTSGRLDIDISGWVPLPAARRTVEHILSIEDIRKLFDACAGHTRIRDMTLLAFLLETGARRVEAAHLDFSNVSWRESMSGCAFLEVVKGYKDTDKRRTVVFGQKTGKLLQIMRVVYGRDLLEGSVFDLTTSGIGFVMRGISNRAGVTFKPHDLRKTFATYWMRNCQAASPSLAERLLQIQLGHSPTNITQTTYAILNYEDVAENYVSPLDGIELFGL